MSFDLCNVESDTNDSLNEIFSGLINDLSSHWNGHQVSLEDAIILNDAIQDKVIRFLFSQDPNSPCFEKITSRLVEIGTNPCTFSLANRDIGHLFMTPDGLCFRSRDGVILQVGLRKFWKKHKTAIIVGVVVVAVIATVVAITVTTYGTGSKAAAALGSAAVGGVQACLEDEDEKKKSPRSIQNQTAGFDPPPAPSSPTPETLPAYDTPLFLEDGVISNGQHYAY